tara:strand:- start:286 stop:471 length:186 start_codon:yes stop_codon:yes gene_type:complete
MTRKEFEKTEFRKGDKAIYHGIECTIVAIEFVEGLLGLKHKDYDQIDWARCESIMYKPLHS